MDWWTRYFYAFWFWQFEFGWYPHHSKPFITFWRGRPTVTASFAGIALGPVAYVGWCSAEFADTWPTWRKRRIRSMALTWRIGGIGWGSKLKHRDG